MLSKKCRPVLLLVSCAFVLSIASSAKATCNRPSITIDKTSYAPSSQPYVTSVGDWDINEKAYIVVNGTEFDFAQAIGTGVFAYHWGQPLSFYGMGTLGSSLTVWITGHCSDGSFISSETRTFTISATPVPAMPPLGLALMGGLIVVVAVGASLWQKQVLRGRAAPGA
jgi:hypothetical protein